MWQNEDNKLHQKFTFKDFKQAFFFMTRVAAIAEEQQHHPTWQNEWNTVEIWLSTHDAGDKITAKDHELADAITEVYEDISSSEGNQQTEPKPQAFKEAKLYTDGGSRGNPGPSAYGFVLLTMQDETVVSHGEYIGITTNNQAEYQSLKHGVEEAISRGVSKLHVYMDSMLVINQMKGVYNVKNRDLWPIYNDIKEQVKKFTEIEFTHVPREHNKLADAMVNEALDAQENSV